MTRWVPVLGAGLMVLTFVGCTPAPGVTPGPTNNPEVTKGASPTSPASTTSPEGPSTSPPSALELEVDGRMAGPCLLTPAEMAIVFEWDSFVPGDPQISANGHECEYDHHDPDEMFTKEVFGVDMGLRGYGETLDWDGFSWLSGISYAEARSAVARASGFADACEAAAESYVDESHAVRGHLCQEEVQYSYVIYPSDVQAMVYFDGCMVGVGTTGTMYDERVRDSLIDMVGMIGAAPPC